VRLIVVGLFVAACYAPSAPAGVPCSDTLQCPTGQTCRGSVCRLDGDIDAGTDAKPDAPANCASGDGVCLASCVFVDTDCVTTCGDNRCVGNTGELCNTCASDCQTTEVVCGNGECQAGESPDCFADCGPVPWSWATEEQTLEAMVNARRNVGFMCPGAMAVVTRPALAVDDTMEFGAHEWSWEIAHQNFFQSGGNACNGRTNEQRKPAYGNFTSYVQSRGHADIQVAFDSWYASASICALLMSDVPTKFRIGVAMSNTRGYVVLLK